MQLARALRAAPVRVQGMSLEAGRHCKTRSLDSFVAKGLLFESVHSDACDAC